LKISSACAYRHTHIQDFQPLQVCSPVIC